MKSLIKKLLFAFLKKRFLKGAPKYKFGKPKKKKSWKYLLAKKFLD